MAEDENRAEEPSTPRSFRENRSGIKENENRAEEPLLPARQNAKPEQKLQQDRAEEPLLPARQNAKPEQKLQQDKNLPTSQTETPQPRSGMPEPLPSARVLRDRPIIVGFGPAGMFAALILAQAGLRPLVLERGQEVDKCQNSVSGAFWREGTLNEQSNVQFGEGGAGTFSDGKLTTGIKDARIRKVLEEFVAAGAPKEILYKQKPHIGTDVLRLVVKNIREEIKRLGGEVRFHTLVEDLRVEDGRVSGVICAQDGAETDHESGAQPQEQNCGDLAPKLAQNSEDSRGAPRISRHASRLRTDAETLRLNLRKIQKTAAELAHFKTRRCLRTEAEPLRLNLRKIQKTAAAFLHAASLAKRSSSPWDTVRATHFAVYARVALR